MHELSHKGYEGCAYFCPYEKIYYGNIDSIDALVSYEACAYEDIQAAFQEAVDEYIESLEVKNV